MNDRFYWQAFFAAFAATAAMTPLFRLLALRLGVLDHPTSPVKTHSAPTPYLGGAAIFLALAGTLLLLRGVTHFPTGTLRSLRFILLGAGSMLLLGLVDDIKPGGLSFRWKFFFQFLAASLLLWADVRIKFIHPPWLAALLTVVWVVGVTNAFNLIDIMDGLAASQAFIASLGFLLISLPTEEVFVNAAAAAAAGACLAFIPYNLSGRFKIFMGDAGSLALGYLMASLSLGTAYSTVNEVGVFAPLLILGLPLYDTFFVCALRIRQGKSPFLGSKDHLALKLQALGLSRRVLVALLAAVAAVFSCAAFLVTWLPLHISIFLFAFTIVVGLYVVVRLHRVPVP